MKRAGKTSITRQNTQLLGELWKTATFDSTALDNLVEIAKSLPQQNAKIEADIANEDLYVSLTTNRNRNLITQEGQEKLRSAVVAFFGMSVGSHAVTTWMLESRAKTVKIADPDTIDGTNLNRLRIPWKTIGKKKVAVLKQQLQEINPYAVVISTDSVSISTVKKVFDDEPKIAAVVDEIDDVKGKVLLRTLARERNIPLVSATDVGDSVLLDVERYDMVPQPKFFLGRAGDIESIHLDEMTPSEKIQYVLKIIGIEYFSIPLLRSILEIGKNIGTWPQLAATATISGGVVTTALKRMFLGEPIPSGRYIVPLDTLFSPLTTEERDLREELLQKVKTKFDI